MDSLSLFFGKATILLAEVSGLATIAVLLWGALRREWDHSISEPRRIKTADRKHSPPMNSH